MKKILISFSILLAWLGFASAELLCPYDAVEIEGIFHRTVTLSRQTIVPLLRTELGVPDNRSPFKIMAEVSVGGRTGANQAIIAIDYASLTPVTQLVIRNTGCTNLATPAEVEAATVPAREPVVVGGQLTYDNADTTRLVVHPDAVNAPRNPPRTSLAIPWSSLFAFIAPPNAEAVSPGPQTSIRYTCPGTDDPLTGIWASEIDTGNAGGLGEASGRCGRIATAGTASSYFIASFALNHEAFFTCQDCTTTGSSALVAVWIGVDLPGTATPTGYFLRATEQDAAADEITLNRWNGSSLTTICGAAIAQETADGDKFLIRRVGTTIYMNASIAAGAWQVLDSCADTTYPNGKFAGFESNAASLFFDDMGGGSLSGGRRVWEW